MLRRKLFLSSVVLFVLLSLSLVVSAEVSWTVWSKTYGGTEEDGAHSLVETSDGGFAIAGTTRSFGPRDEDFWLVKTDATGNVEWNQTYGGTDWGADVAYELVKTSNGGYAIAGYTDSFGAGSYDFFLVKTDALGYVEWNRTYGGKESEKASSLIATSDGGYALAGDALLVKADAYGNMEWSKTIGRSIHSLVETSDGGYALAGSTRSFSGDGTSDFWLVKTDAYGNMEWNQTYGGTGNDDASSLVATSDGGYALAGSTRGFGYSDCWLVKTDAYGNMEWNQTYGGTNDDSAYSLIETSDGGYALAGSTYSLGNGSSDAWLVKTDALGNMEWNQPHGGTEDDWASSLVETSDGRYAIAGTTHSFGAGESDCWLVKTNAGGNMEWGRTYGGPGSENLQSLVATSDGGYALAGYTGFYAWLVKTDGAGNMEWNQRYGGSADQAVSLVATSDGGYAMAGSTESFGDTDGDFWLVKTDGAGNMQWNQGYGGTQYDRANSLVATSDGGYALAGYTFLGFTFSGDLIQFDYDFWLVKTDAFGNMEWTQTYGGTNDDSAFSLVATSDGGYAMAGYTNSFGAGNRDFYLVKTDEYGNVEWTQTYGGTEPDYASSLVETSDGGYAIAGSTWSFGAGQEDFWLVKTDASGEMEWHKTYGGPEIDIASSLVVTSDGGYALVGATGNPSAGETDFWLVKTDAFGNMEWNQTYGGTENDFPSALVATSDGGYAMAGSTESFGAGDYDFWLVKTGESGIIPEFPSWVLPPLLLIATLVIVIYKKKLFQIHERIEQ